MAKSALEMQNDRLKSGAGMINALPHMMAIDEKMSPSSMDSEMFGEMRKPLGQEGIPKHGIYALLDGLFAGAQLGSKQKMKAEQAEKYKSMKNMTDLIMSNWKQSETDLQDLQNKEKGQEELSTFISPVVRSSLDPDVSQDEYYSRSEQTFDNMKKVYQELNGFELDGAIHGKDYWIIKGQDGKTHTLPFAELIGKTRFGEDVTQANERMNAGSNRIKAEASKMRAEDDHTYRPQELGIRKQEAANARYRTVEIAAKRHEKLLTEVTPKIEASKRMVVVTERMKSIAQSHSDIFQNILHDVWASPQGSEEGIATLWKKKATDDATARAISNMVKYSSELKADMFKTLSPKGMNIFSEKILAASSPDHKMQSDAFFDTLDDVNRHAQDSLELHLERLKETQGILGEESKLADFYERNADKYIEGERTHNEMTPEGKPNENYGKPKNSVDTGATTSNPNKGSGNVHIYKAPDGKGGFKEWNLTPEQYNAIPEEKRGKLKMVR